MPIHPYRTLTPEAMQLLSDIFRLIVREIRTTEDKEKLAPGEMGISYEEGCFYIRNPHTGELFSPNSLSFLNQILEKYDPVTNIFNADKVSGVRFYSDIKQLDQLEIDLTADSVVRQMEYPSILMSKIEYENYETMGFPSELGMMMVYKISPETVYATYYDYRTYTSYIGKYNPFTHYLEGWVTTGNNLGSWFVETIGGGSSTRIEVDMTIDDFSIITAHVTEDIDPNATLQVNDMEYLPLIDVNGEPISTTISANNIIMLLYDKQRNAWVVNGNTESIINTIINVVNDRLTETINRVNILENQLTEKVNELYSYINTELKKPGTIVTSYYVFTASIATDTVNRVENYVHGLDKLVVLYNQTIISQSDYTIASDGSIQFKFTIPKDDKVEFIVIKQVLR